MVDLLKEKCRKEGVDLVQTMMHVLNLDEATGRPGGANGGDSADRE